MKKEDFPFMMTAKDIEEILGVSNVKAHEIMLQKDFPLIRIGRHKKVQRERFFQWLDKQEKIS